MNQVWAVWTSFQCFSLQQSEKRCMFTLDTFRNSNWKYYSQHADETKSKNVFLELLNSIFKFFKLLVRMRQLHDKNNSTFPKEAEQSWTKHQINQMQETFKNFENFFGFLKLWRFWNFDLSGFWFNHYFVPFRDFGYLEF